MVNLALVGLEESSETDYAGSDTSSEVCLVVKVKSNQWILDSGCTRHMSGK